MFFRLFENLEPYQPLLNIDPRTSCRLRLLFVELGVLRGLSNIGPILSLVL